LRKKYKSLGVGGAMLDKQQLELYMKKIAADHILSVKSDRRTFPVPRVKDNLKFIFDVYNILNEDIRNKLPIHPAGEWLLDNYYIIEKISKVIISDLSIKKYTNLLGIANGRNSGYARAYIIANEIVSYTDGKIDGDDIELFLKAYQSKKTLSMEELWSIVTFLQIALIEKIREICEKIYLAQMQKRKVENIVMRLVEFKEENKINNNLKIKVEDTSDSKYPFIEYMSYRLKKYGIKAYNYVEILENQVNKMGSTISECIDREHYDIATKKVSIGNSVTSLNMLTRLNYVEIFDKINGVEEVLKRDPAKVYEKMDYKTKEYYRNCIEKISKKTKISELYIAQKCLEIASKNKGKKEHIGYYIIDKGKNELLENLLNKKIKNKNNNILYLSFFNLFISVIISAIIAGNINIRINNWLISIFVYFLLVFLSKNIFGKISQYVSGKIIKPKIIPKLDFYNGVPEEYRTMVVIPTIISDTKKVGEIFKKLEVYYHANKSNNIYFSLLGDCTCEKKEISKHDKEVVNECIEWCRILNEKYVDYSYPKFNFVYRKRQWCEGENSYLGWERKRGLLTQFNEYILGKEKNIFYYNSFEMTGKEIPKIKYIITLDSDTSLTLNTGLELIGAMAHILNHPEIDEEKNIVKSGYGIIQPRVGIGIEEANRSIFSKLFAGVSGTDSYTNAISDFYYDNYNEGIYTGKGIFDTEIFSKILINEIPENKVLSHDLLEGCYLKCGLASDIILMDGFPSSYDGYRSRLHRWVRGDFQIIEWLFNKKINILSKYKIIDNLCRSFFDFVVVLLSFLGIVTQYKLLIFIAIFATIFPYFLNVIDKIIVKKNGQSTQKKFNKEIGGIKLIIYKSIIEFFILPDKAYIGIDAAVRSLYRLFISKKHLLEWTTSEENEKNSKNGIIFYYKKMIANIFMGILFIYFGIFFECILGIILGGLWLLAPAIINSISRPIASNSPYDLLSEEEKDYVYEIGSRTWQFFKDFLIEKNNYLPPDNYQNGRKNEVVLRTSPTNIGLALLSVVSSYDLGYENRECSIDLIDKMLNTIEKLPKWNGHLFNWYNICNLTPLFPKYVSSVDSGNFVGYLYVLKQFLINLNSSDIRIKKNVDIINNLINDTDFSKLFSTKTGLFSIGFNCEENKMTDSYYDLLASEARQTSIVAIAKKDISSKHWKNLSRALTTLDKYKGLISWSGTAFEYLMPTVNIKRYPGSLLDESCKFMIMSQIEYSKKLGTTWGFSEAAFNLKDFNGNYQYKAFGIPWLGLKRGLADEIVVSSYGTILAITDEPQKVIKNLKRLEGLGMYNKYGFYESVDYTPGRAEKQNKYSIVETYMAHHQGLILLSLNNLMNDNILQRRFSKNPEIGSVDILLQEKMPDNVIITKEKKEHIEKIKYSNFDYYLERKYEKYNENKKIYNLICNNNYSVLIDENGLGYSKYNDICINRYKPTDENSEGIIFYLKDSNKNKIWNTISDNKIQTIFYPDKNIFVNENYGIKTKSTIFLSTENPVEIRCLNIKNLNQNVTNLELYTFFEPVLSTIEQDYAHKAFNKLFLSFEYFDNTLLIKRRARNENDKGLYMAITLFSEGNKNQQFEYEINKLNFEGRNNYDIPEAIKYQKKFGNNTGANTNQIVALRKKLEINSDKEENIYLIIGVSDQRNNAIENVKKYCNSENISRAMKLSRAQTEAMIQYMGISGRDVNIFERVLTQLLNNCGKVYCKDDKYLDLSPNKLWKYGISGKRKIILFEINEICEIDILKKLVKCYEFLRHQNFKVDLVILNSETESYENYLQDTINEIVWNYINDYNKGIFILKNISPEDKKILEIRADFIIQGKCGKIEYLLDELDHKECKNIKMFYPKNNDESERNYKYEQKFDMKKLQFYNGYGGFFNKEYIININKNKTTPYAWSNIIANDKFGTVITENMGGYTWYKNSRLNRITSWNNDSISDLQSELIYFLDTENNCSWNASLGPIKDSGEFYIVYGFGYAEFVHATNNIEQNMMVFIPQNDALKINIIKLKNLLTQKRKIRVSYYIKLALDEDEINSKGYIYTDTNVYSNYTLIKNLANENFKYWMVLSSSEKILNVQCSGNVLKCELDIEIASLEEKIFSLFFCCDDDESSCIEIAKKYQNTNYCLEKLEETKKNWRNLLDKISINTPVHSINNLCNGWIMYQTYCSRMLAKTGYSQSGGAWGYRDQLQDSMSMKYFDANIEKNQIIKHCQHQFIEGDVLHWWHEETRRGVRTRFSDDLLWLVYVVYDYIEYTGDYDILNVDVQYLDGNILEPNIDEKYDLYQQSNIAESIYMHCVRAIEKSINMGKHGIPKIGSGDWNDGFNLVGKNGQGESVWLGFFLYDILNKFIKLCEHKNDVERIRKYQNISKLLKENLNKNCWDGRWFNRAFCDNEGVIGSIKNEECKIDGISQSWAVISDATDNARANTAMNSLQNYLVDKNYGIIKLLTPPFEKGAINPGYIMSYLPGTRENGGQYTHGAIWAIIAEAKLDNAKNAVEYLKMINPIEHSSNIDSANKYKLEPYVICADIYSNGDMYGQGGWSWYTGSAGWYYICLLKYILGVQIKNNILTIQPHIPEYWGEYSISYRYGESVYNINVKNQSGGGKNVFLFCVNGISIESKSVKLKDDGSVNYIDVYL